MNNLSLLLASCGVIESFWGSILTIVSQCNEKIDSIVERHILYPGCNFSAIRNDIEQDIKSKYSVLLITVGCLLQVGSLFVNNVLPGHSVNFILFWCAIGLSFVLPILCYVCFIKQRIKKATRKASELIEQKK